MFTLRPTTVVVASLLGMVALGMFTTLPQINLLHARELCPSPCRGCDILRGAVSSGIVDPDFVFKFPNDVEAPPLIGRLTHVWTACTFGRGSNSLTVYNRFQSRRLNGCAENIAYYFVHGGDGDSWWRGSECSENHVQLPGDRWRLIRAYGPISEIRIIDHPPECHRTPAPGEREPHGHDP